MSEKKGIRGLFKNLINHSAEEDAASVSSEEAAQADPLPAEGTSEVGGETEPVAPAGQFAMKGALLQLWRVWANRAAPPTLNLAGDLAAEELVLDNAQLDREALRLSVQLENDAKRRVKKIEDARLRMVLAQQQAEARRNESGAEGDNPEEAEPTLDMDAECKLYVSRDKMLAWFFLFPPLGEGKLPVEEMGKLLRDGGIITGVRTEVMLRIAQDRPYFRFIPIAIGTPPVEGEDGSVIERYARTREKEVMVDEKGLADYKYQNYVYQVMKGDVLCDIILPVPGQSGLRVDGSVVQPKPVRAAKVPMGVNTAVTEDGLQLVATMDGHLEFTGQSFHVRPVLVVKGDVDYEVGNIQFTGDVHIQGDVRENFIVSATGSVTVDGLVEAATIEAGGDLTITRGVVGDNRAFLKSNGCVRVKYLENCVVYAGKTVYADCIMNSQIFSDVSIEVLSGRGSVIGGALTAAEKIKAKMIGAQSGRRTELTLGVLPFVQNELSTIEGDLEANEKEKQELDKQLNYLERAQGLEGASAKLAKIRMRRTVLDMKEQNLIKRREKLEPMVPDISRCRLECDEVYPITNLTVLEAVWTAKEIRRHCRIAYDSQQRCLTERV